MIHLSAITESIDAPTLIRPAFLHSLDPKETLSLGPKLEQIVVIFFRLFYKAVDSTSNVVKDGRLP